MGLDGTQATVYRQFMQELRSGVTAAIKAVGSGTNLAKAVGVTRQAICQWHKIPAERVIEIERLTGVPRQTLRPDLYETENNAAAPTGMAAGGTQ